MSDIDRIFDLIGVGHYAADALSAEEPPLAVDEAMLRALHNHELDFVARDEVVFLISHYQAWWDANARITADLARETLAHDGLGGGDSNDSPSTQEPIEYDLGRFLDLEYRELIDEFSPFAGSARSGKDLLAPFRAKLRQVVCEEWNWSLQKDDPRWENRRALAAQLVAVLTPRKVEIGLPDDALPIVAAILVKEGLTNFCNIEG